MSNEPQPCCSRCSVPVIVLDGLEWEAGMMCHLCLQTAYDDLVEQHRKAAYIIKSLMTSWAVVECGSGPKGIEMCRACGERCKEHSENCVIGKYIAAEIAANCWEK